jgi:hypothetical protein
VRGAFKYWERVQKKWRCAKSRKGRGWGGAERLGAYLRFALLPESALLTWKSGAETGLTSIKLSQQIQVAVTAGVISQVINYNKKMQKKNAKSVAKSFQGYCARRCACTASCE